VNSGFNSQVYEIMTSEAARLPGWHILTKRPETGTDGRYGCVAASATETARLLLNSKSKLFPDGLGNRYDWVGRNLQGHAYCGADGLFEEEVYDDVGPGASVAIADFAHNNPGMVGGAMLANEFIRMPYLFTGVRPPGSARWGKDTRTSSNII
jgi:hypothetical protein